MSDVILGDNIKMYLETGTFSGTFDSEDAIETEIFSFEQTGGEFETETKQLLGNANIVVRKPQTEFELSFEVAIKTEDATRWDKVFYGEGLTSATRGSNIAIGLEGSSSDGTTVYQNLFENVNVVSFEKSLEAGDHLTGSLSLQVAPTDSDGNANVEVGESDVFTVD